jgi:DNA-binding MarR family transcriptional regulator
LTRRKFLRYSDYGFPRTVKVASRRKATKETPATETVSQALDLLEAFLSRGPAPDSAELAGILKVDRETVQRLLATLEARAYIQAIRRSSQL